ncbi:hypothetical protein TrCOL_g7653 [Triparma columacea]|uniref:Uncharacterized protein n=1 Tax=Triparma columacea TaxID=722753 RepID=A0A9W7G9Z1_9STRA|nr:hypothetical protein TrCOL_g7653 [Triparma columacea]
MGKIWGWISNSDSLHFNKYVTKNDKKNDKNTTNKNLFSYPTLLRGLKARAIDEVKLRSLSSKAHLALQSQDRVQMAQLAQEMSRVAYGRGVTAQKRQVSLERFGCVEWTPLVMDLIADFASGRGVVEIGAGNGQWSRRLSDMGCDVVAFDDMSGVPLNRNLYHGGTKPNRDHFFSAVRKGDSSVFRGGSGSGYVGEGGRVLLIVYPDRSGWALETVTAWMKQSTDNTAMVYVGEGRNGANACEGFFDLLEGEGWRVVRVEDLGCKGGKGYEKAFFMERVVTDEGSE